jgi:hypothetical protein
MVVGGRSAVWVVWLMASVACGPKAVPATAARAPAGMDGTWWLTDGFEGPVRGSLEFDGRGMELRPVGGGPSVSFSLHRDGREWEAIGDGGLIVRLDRLSDDALVLYRADGRTGIVWRATPLPAALGGRWLVQDPATGAVDDATFVGGPIGEPGLLTRGSGSSAELWTLARGDGGWALVGRRDGEVELTQLHQLPDGAWLWIGPEAGVSRVLYRDEARPRWLPQPVTEDAG